MKNRTLLLLLIKTFVILWIVSVVVECEISKRDVHRIILQEERPRIIKRGHRHTDHHHHHHHHKHHGQGSKKKHHHHHSHENSHSFENDDSGSYSREHKYDKDVKIRKSRGHEKQKKHRKPEYNSKENLSDNFYKDVTKQFLKDEWTPLVHSANTNQFSFDNHRFKHRKPRKDNSNNKKFQTKFPNIELTTSFPQTIPFSSFQSTLYPPLDLYQNQSPLIGPVALYNPLEQLSQKRNEPLLGESKLLDDPNKPNYQVHENVEDQTLKNEELTFQALLPLIDVAKAQFAGEETVLNENKATINNQTVIAKNEKVKAGRTRGRTRF